MYEVLTKSTRRQSTLYMYTHTVHTYNTMVLLQITKNVVYTFFIIFPTKLKKITIDCSNSPMFSFQMFYM